MRVIAAFVVGLALAAGALGWKVYSLEHRLESQVATSSPKSVRPASAKTDDVSLRPSIDELDAVPTEGLAQKAPAETSNPVVHASVAAEPTPVVVDNTPMPEAKGGAEIGVTPELIEFIEERMLAKIPDDVEQYFDMLLYVSRGTRGPYAQKLYAFEREGTGFKPYAQWLASTGREQDEKYWTGTPDGIFRLDHSRFYQMRMSSQWGTPMPFAMFFDLEYDHIPTGYAIHAAGIAADAEALGTRASAGCVRLHPEHAKQLFEKIRKEMWGKIPVFAYDNETNSTSLTGEAKRNKSGKLVFRKGYKVLLIVEDFDRGPTTDLAAAGDY
jgi:lipoprotein-anchoring transpeptidase ErfK/SrfK